MPVVRIATFSTWADADRAEAISTNSSGNRGGGRLIVLPSSIPNREDHPAPNHQHVQHDADGEHRLHSAGARRSGTTLDDPELIDQSADREGKKERLQA